MSRSVNNIGSRLQNISILSRLASPLASKKPRNVSEYGIELEEPHKTFAPGDSVRGSVILNVERPMRITHLTICLHGVVKVLKNGKTPDESISRWRAYLASGQGKWGDTYFGNGLAALFKDEITLSGDGCLVASSYRFRFELELPCHELPSSIDVSVLTCTVLVWLTSSLVSAWTHLLYALGHSDPTELHFADLQV